MEEQDYEKKFLSALLLCCMVLTLLPTAALADGDVAIDGTNFPDENFRQYVNTEFDTNNDDSLSAEEIAAVKQINLPNKGISSLVGVEHFTNLEDLDVQHNEDLTTLNLSKNTELKTLKCNHTKLTSLDTSHNENLVFLECNEISTLTTLNVSGSTALKHLYCNDNPLTALDLTNNLALEKLECGGNKFTTLDLSRNTNLKYFGCFNSKLSSLDLTNNTELEELYFCGNNVSNIDVSKNTKLKFLHLFSNQLITLDTSKNSNLQRLWVYTNPLTSMNLGDSGSTMEVKFDNKPYPIEVSAAEKTFNLNTLPGFDVSKASDWTNGTVNGNILTVDEGVDNVTYTYDCGERQTTHGYPTVTGKLMMPCTLKINWVSAPAITEDVLAGLNFPTDLVTVKCTTTNSSRKYGKIPGGFDLSKKPFIEDGVWKAIVHLKLSAYKDKYDADTNKAHDLKGLGSNPHQTFTLKYVNNMWQLEGDFPKVTILVECEGNHPQEYTITFEGNGGTPSDATMTTVNQKLPQLPKATHSGRYSFDGWYTAASGGTMITTDTEFDKNTTVYAHWTYTGSSGSSSSGRTYHTIKASSDSNGSISPSERVSVRHGRDQSFTITPDKGYEIAKVLVDGKSVGAVESYTFKSVTKNHTIEAIFMKVDDNKPMPDTFMDVPKGSYYEKAVDWAVKNGITAGTGDNYFMPDGICTRAQAVTFLWRVAGSPTPKTEVMPFEDVPEGSYYYEAVLWATENEITVGTSATTFSPELTCSRAHIVSFLWRAAGYPSAGTVNPFTDVPENAYYINAMLWAVKQEITVGTTPSTFSPDEGCTRAQIVTFLYRARSM